MQRRLMARLASAAIPGLVLLAAAGAARAEIGELPSVEMAKLLESELAKAQGKS